MKVHGKCGSVRVWMIPVPRGSGAAYDLQQASLDKARPKCRAGVKGGGIYRAVGLKNAVVRILALARPLFDVDSNL